MQQPKPDPAGLSAQLKRLRIQRDLTIPDVVDRMLTQYGVKRTRQNLYQHERGIRVPCSETVAAYCRVYDLNTSDARRLYELAGYVVVFAVEEG
jgi:transcriptional regulator with XRE-family HTH domain